MDEPSEVQRHLYVGYLGVPRRHALFLAVAVPLALGAMVIGAMGLATSGQEWQEPWGNGFWATETVEVTGVYSASPYPMVHEPTPDGSVSSHLLVQIGKFGVASSFDTDDRVWLDGADVVVTGVPIERDGRRMLEVDLSRPIEEVIRPAEVPVDVAPEATELKGVESMTLSGEIVDAKCYMGAMKPGRGRGHKACATLCVQGGIPPIVYSVSPEGDARYHLLVDQEGRGLTGERLDEVLPFIGDPITVTGAESRVGSWRVLRIVSGKITPL
ncbi:MAG: hypothetical protein AAGI53_05440 [Planctomycetota bacterium]